MTILSLFDYTGTWCQPYRTAGYDVVQIDLKHGSDVLTWDYTALSNVHGILAAPPCTDFAVSGAQYWAAKDADGRTEHSVALVRKTLEIIRQCAPVWWCLENPVGRLNTLVPELVRYGPQYVEPWWYGDLYTKKTGLWGWFRLPLPTQVHSPKRFCSQGSWLMQLGGKSERTKALRSATPPGFAQAFFESNP